MNRKPLLLVALLALAMSCGAPAASGHDAAHDAAHDTASHPAGDQHTRSSAPDSVAAPAVTAVGQQGHAEAGHGAAERGGASDVGHSPGAAPAGPPGAATPRPRPEIPSDWPAGKRIVLHITPSLDQSFIVACDIPVPAMTYLRRGHQVTMIADRDAVTAFRRDADGKSPLDRLDLLPDDLDELSTLLGVPRAAVPTTFGDLYRALGAQGLRIVANEDALKLLGVPPSEIDPAVEILPGSQIQAIMQNLDALLPYDDISPLHSIFAHRTH